jgi:hypothetical protein
MQLPFWLCLPFFRLVQRAELMDVLQDVDGVEPATGPNPVEKNSRKWYPSVDDLQRAHGIVWSQLVDLEPRIETLLWRARQVGVRCRTRADVESAFHSLRDELTGLIGFFGKHHRHPVLGSVGAYEVAYWKLYDAVAGLLPGHNGSP